MKKTAAIILGILMCGILLSACDTKGGKSTGADAAMLNEDLFGTWTEEYFDSSYIFNSDGTGKDTFWDLTFTYTATEDGILTLTFDDDMWGITEYIYTIDGDRLSLRQEDSADTFEYTRE